jgi:hypothetical protein
MVSLEWHSCVDRNARTVYENHSISLPQRWPFVVSRVVRLPTKPIVLGTVVNSLGYAVVVALSAQFIMMLLRRLRIKRGLCPACAYPVGAGGTCTECGYTLNIVRS